MKGNLAVAVLVASITCPTSVLAQEAAHVTAFDAPSTFRQTLENPNFPISVVISDRRLEQSPVSDSGIWVYFLPDEASVSRIPLVHRVYVEDLVTQGQGFLLRGRIEPGGRKTAVIAALLSRTERSEANLGCFAALEVLRSIYGKILFSVEEMTAVCSDGGAAS